MNIDYSMNLHIKEWKSICYLKQQSLKKKLLLSIKKAYDYIAGKACVLGIVPDLDNYEFQQYIKGYAIPTSTNKELNDKLAEFAEFIDIYENAESNKIIISCLKEKEF